MSILNKGKPEILLMLAMCYQQALLELGGEKLEADAKKSCRLSMSYPMDPLPSGQRIKASSLSFQHLP